MNSKKTPPGKVVKKLRDQFIAGILVIVPAGATILILVWVFNSIDHILQPLVKAIFHHDVPGVGFGVTIVLIYLAGVIATNVIGRRILRFINSLLDRVPIFRQLSSGIRQILESFAAPNKTGFMQVVLVEFPKVGMRALGFVTNELKDENGEKLLSILIPTAPNPTSGFLQIVKEKDVIRTKISVDEALKMIVSAGRMTPTQVKENIQNF
ncbi:MAG: DUF502 domain-containing protein [Dehalococcoidales bacterium]|jgi:uncharacterized membrane protein